MTQYYRFFPYNGGGVQVTQMSLRTYTGTVLQRLQQVYIVEVERADMVDRDKVKLISKYMRRQVYEDASV